MKPRVSMREALTDTRLLGHVLQGETWLAWRVLLIAAMGEALTDSERAIFTRFTGREREPMQRVAEFAAIIGRRGGKTTAMSAVATYLSACCDHSDALARGETGVCLLVAQDQKVARKLLEFIESYLTDSPILCQLIKNRTADSIELTNNISIEVRPASFRRLRGPTYIGLILDEIAFWLSGDEYVNPDTEVLAALRPGLMTTGGPLIMASSPYAKRGVLWDAFRKHHGPDGSPSVLVAKGTTREFNGNIPQREVDAALERDHARNSAELLAEFRSDLESYVNPEVVASALGSYFEMAPSRATTYYGFTDPSGGSRDSFTLAISHRAGADAIVVDCIREIRPPFLPEVTISELAALAKSYFLHSITGDRYGGQFPVEQFGKRGIRLEPSLKSKSELYGDFLPLLNSGSVTLPRNDRLIAQLCALERVTARGGRDSIDHPKGDSFHDDVANAVAGAVCLARSHGGYAEALGAAMEDDVVPRLPSWQERERDRRRAELQRRYLAPIHLGSPPPEMIPEHLREAFERARASAREAAFANSMGGEHGPA